MNGIDEATAWLKANAPEWMLRRGEATLIPGLRSGEPTRHHVRVTLVERDALVKQAIGSGYVELDGEGETYLEAVQLAVGAAPSR